jgi:hypothetical protein
LAVIYPASKRLAARSNFDGAVWLPRRPADNLVAVAVAALIRNFATFDGPSDSEA